jgi:hypothetical protein
MMTAEEIDQVADAVAVKLQAFQRPVLTRPIAMVYTAQESDSAFDRWCAKWGVKPVAWGRYSRRWLDRGLDNESRTGRRTAASADVTQSEEKHAA